jgi:transposase
VRGRKLSFSITLSPEEQAELERRCRMTTVAVGQFKRAQAILLLAAHVSEKETAVRCGLGIRIVRKWGRRFQQERLAGLVDRAGRGRKPTFSP